MDELAHATGVDPVALRLLNDTEINRLSTGGRGGLRSDRGSEWTEGGLQLSAVFAEVRVDPELGLVRLRFVGASSGQY
jgi:hypothetical protein